MDAEVLEFGEALLTTGDLDPVYFYIDKGNWEEDVLKRWLLAYSMFYHVGVANWLSEYKGQRYWQEAFAGLPGTKLGGFPRGEERRHFRGLSANTAIKFMREFEPEAVVDSWYRQLDFAGVSKNVQKYPLYGPWIAFKLADMGERCLRLPIDFSNCELGVYQEPRAGAALVLTGDSHAAITNPQLLEVVNYVLSNLKGYMAPPRFDRPINIQEAETILCKYKSMKGGHYYVGKDIEAVKRAAEWRRNVSLQVPDIHH